jgi:hypothetical protein
MRRFSGALAVIFLFALGGGIPGAATCRADVLISPTLNGNPAPGDSRITLNPDGTLTAHYNSLLDTDKVLFPLGQTLTAADSFKVVTRFKILSTNFFADPNGLSQISFGLCNSITTGTDRSSSMTTNGDTFDLVSFDYFPNISSDPLFASPTLAPTVFSSRIGTEGAMSDIQWLWGPESALNGAGESPLPLDTWLSAGLAYDAAARRVTMALATDAGPMMINAGGGLDGDTSTIQMTLPQGVNFNLDSYALLLWKDSWIFGSDPSVRADVVFDFPSAATVPEPATAALLGLAALGVLMRRPSRRR